MKEIKDFEFSSSGNRESKYDWKLLLHGKTYRLTPSEDFKCDVNTFRMMLRKQAGKLGLAVRTQMDDGDLIIQAVEATEEQLKAFQKQEAKEKAYRLSSKAKKDASEQDAQDADEPEEKKSRRRKRSSPGSDASAGGDQLTHRGSCGPLPLLLQTLTKLAKRPRGSDNLREEPGGSHGEAAAARGAMGSHRADAAGAAAPAQGRAAPSRTARP